MRASAHRSRSHPAIRPCLHNRCQETPAGRRIDTPGATLLPFHTEAVHRAFLPDELSVRAPACLLCADAALLLAARRYTRSMQASGDDFAKLHLLRSPGGTTRRLVLTADVSNSNLATVVFLRAKVYNTVPLEMR